MIRDHVAKRAGLGILEKNWDFRHPYILQRVPWDLWGPQGVFLGRFKGFCGRFDQKQLTTVHTHVHTPAAVPTARGDSRLVRSSQGEGVSLREHLHTRARRSRGLNQQACGYQ